MTGRLLVLVRHGQSEWNLSNRFTGSSDVDLTETGVEQARAAGRTLKARGIRFDVGFTSALRRAHRSLGLGGADTQGETRRIGAFFLGIADHHRALVGLAHIGGRVLEELRDALADQHLAAVSASLLLCPFHLQVALYSISRWAIWVAIAVKIVPISEALVAK